MLKKFLIGTVAAIALMLMVVSVASAAYDFGPTTLKVGSKGEVVKTLQTVVGASPVDGIFGMMTKAKVMIWQKANGLTADGLFGAKSKFKANATIGTTFPVGCTSAVGFSSTTGLSCSVVTTLPAGCTSAVGFSTTTGLSCAAVVTALPAGCTSTVGYSPTTGASCSTGVTTGTTLANIPGDISAGYPKVLGTPSNKAVGEGDTNTQVLGFEVKADTGSGVNLTSMKLTFTKTDLTDLSSTRIADFIKTVSVWEGTTKVGSANIADFAKSNTGIYNGTIILSGATVPTNTVKRFYIAVDSNTTVDSKNFDKSWSTEVTSIRFQDGTGVIMTSSVFSPLVKRDFTVKAFADANSIDLKASVTSNNPSEGIVVGKEGSTFDATVLNFTLKAEGSDLTVNKIPVLLTAIGATPSVLATDAVLSWGTNSSDSQSVNSGAPSTVMFGNTSDLGIVITKGSSMTFTVKLTMAKLDGTDFSEGDSIKADLTVLGIQALDSKDMDVATDELNGTANGFYQHFYTIAPAVSVVSSSIVADPNGTLAAATATAKIKIAITAKGGTIYVNGSNPTISGLIVAGDGTANVVVNSYDFVVSGDYTRTGAIGTVGEYFTIEQDKTMYIEVNGTVELTATATERAGMLISAVKFGTEYTDATHRSANTINWSTLTDLLKSGKVLLKK